MLANAKVGEDICATDNPETTTTKKPKKKANRKHNNPGITRIRSRNRSRKICNDWDDDSDASQYNPNSDASHYDYDPNYSQQNPIVQTSHTSTTARVYSHQLLQWSRRFKSNPFQSLRCEIDRLAMERLVIHDEDIAGLPTRLREITEKIPSVDDNELIAHRGRSNT